MPIRLPTPAILPPLDTLTQILMQTATLLRGRAGRKEPIIASGGGVCLDVAGLTANLYRRNTPIIKVSAGDGYHSARIDCWPLNNHIL